MNLIIYFFNIEIVEPMCINYFLTGVHQLVFSSNSTQHCHTKGKFLSIEVSLYKMCCIIM